MTEIKKVVEKATDEIMSHGAWCGHCYCFEYLYDSYVNLTAVMKELDIDTTAVVKAYENTNAEFKKITNSDTLSFLNPSDTKTLNEFDDAFFNKMIKTINLVSYFV